MPVRAAMMNPKILVWAREQQGMSLDWVAVKTGHDRLRLWESGDEKPTLAQLRSLARFYRRPSALFFMSRPPESAGTVNDFRTHAAGASPELSPEARTEIRLCESRRAAALELADSLDLPSRLTLPELRLDDDVERSAEAVRTALAPDSAVLKGLRDSKLVLEYWVSLIERKNTLVFRSITLSSFNTSFKVIRGTSAYYPDFPWILLNSQEHEHAQLFTLMHELAHVLLRDGGVCNLEETEASASGAAERFCNAVAAAILMPADAVLPLVGSLRATPSEENREAACALLSRSFHVSREAAARRLVTLGLADVFYYQAVRRRQIEELDADRLKRKEEPGGNGRYYHKRVLSWNGRAFCSLVIDAYHRDRLTLADAAEALRTKTHFVEDRAQAHFPGAG